MKDKGLLEQILDKCTTIESVQRGLPNEDRVRLIIREEQRNCPAFRNFGTVADRAAENAGQLKAIRDSGLIRRSIAPAARMAARAPWWLKILVPALAIVGALLGVDVGWVPS